MRESRLTLAVDSGLFVLPPAGQIAVFGPPAGEDLSALPRDRVTVVQGFRPDHDHFAAQGWAVAPAAEGDFAAAVVFLPRAKAAAHALIAEAAARLPLGAPIVVEGAKTDGIDAVTRELRARTDIAGPLAKAHGKVLALANPGAAAFADWAAEGAARTVAEGFVTRAGVFSADAPDRGSMLLAAALPARLGPRVVDLGAGWGYLSRAILTRPDVKELHLVEADHAALACARENVPDPRAQFHWADATRLRLPGPVDTVVMNPPFHTGRTAQPALGTEFIRAAAAMLTPGGSLWMVANRHLPYDAALRAAFREVEEVGGDGAFRISHASRPVPVRPARPPHERHGTRA